MNESVLIIDDDRKLNNLLLDYLAQFAFRVSAVTSPREGLRQIKQNEPDAVILDIMLPEMDGFETCKEIRKISSVPILMLTARGDVTDRILGLEIGADDYLLVFNFQRNPGEHNSSLLILLAGITLILVFTYHAIKKVLKPVRLLENGVQQVNRANFEYQVPVCSRDELGRLTVSFNNMILRIRDMIAAREQLLLDVSHELGSPLTRVKVALEKVKNRPVRLGIADDIREMETMVTEILESERLKTKHGSLRRQDTDLVAMIQATIEQYSGRKPGVSLVASPTELVINIDPDRIQICLKNIIENALKYSPPEAPPVQIFLNSMADHVELKIQDFGQGIPEEDLNMVIEPFYRVDKSRTKETGGYGLGLNLCQKIIEAHGGNLNLKSAVGQGTTVIITLPLRHQN